MLASLPRTKNTSSPTPAPTESAATITRPTGSRDEDIGCTSSNVTPLSVSFLLLRTTFPTTRPSCMGSVLDFDLVDDADNGGIHRAILHARRHARRAAADNQHGLAEARV